MAKLKLQGVMPLIATPFDRDGEIYAAKVRHNVDKWNKVKLAGYVACGATGEGGLLTTDEKVEMWSLVAESAAPDRLLVAGILAEGVRESLLLANKAVDIGYRAVLARVPRERDSSSDLYFASLADRCKVPVILDGAVDADTVVRLSQHPNIVAARVESGDVAVVLRLLRECKTGFQVLAGSAASFWPALHVGASGGMLDFANPAPYACITIWEAYRTREQEAALDWQNRIGGPSLLVGARHGIAGLKYAMDLNGYYGGPCRLPIRPLCAGARREIEAAFDNLRG